FSALRPPPISTLFPYTTLFRSGVAAGIALGILQIDLVDFAGVAPIMIYHAEKREVVTIAGLGTWPKALDPELFMREHGGKIPLRSEEHTSELQSRFDIVCRLLL